MVIGWWLRGVCYLSEVLQDVKATATFISSKMNKERTNVQGVIKEYTNLDLTKEELKRLKKLLKRRRAY
ncbi:hypothetical protein [Alkalihalobacillus deserti]|uniref:hypothetical protein n=1 Tax=Alkalihalobacillus deserti TaxID=2879466 RepID=UPI001D153BD3|nr:hypothetical protein [Alkalihalobacillus deserti]